MGGHHQAEPLQVEDEDVLCHLDIQLDSSRFLLSFTPQSYFLFGIKLAYLTFNARFSHKRFNKTKIAHKLLATTTLLIEAVDMTILIMLYHTGLLSSLVFCLI